MSQVSESAPRLLLMLGAGTLCVRRLQDKLASEQWTTHAARDADAGVAMFLQLRPPVVILDDALPGHSYPQVLEFIRRHDPAVSVIMTSQRATVERAVEAMQRGATDFVPLPADCERLSPAVYAAWEKAKRRQERLAARAPATPEPLFEQLVQCGAMAPVARRLCEVLDQATPVVLEGESGTGRNRIGRLLHHASHRRFAPFVEVHAAGLSHDLLGEARTLSTGASDATGTPDDLFGVAAGGTVYLEAIETLSPSTQLRLAALLEEQRDDPARRGDKSDVRIIASTTRGLAREAAAGRFHPPLAALLAPATVAIPALRERGPAEISRLAARFLLELRTELGIGPTTIAADAHERLGAYLWPGNVRELRAVIEQGMLRAAQVEVLRAEHLELGSAQVERDRRDDLSLQRLERVHIAHVLARTRGNRSQAARVLGITRTTLYKKLREYGLDALAAAESGLSS